MIEGEGKERVEDGSKGRGEGGGVWGEEEMEAF